MQTTGLSLQHALLALYLVTLGLLYAGLQWIGARFYRTRWAGAALAAALTLRHAIAKTGANTLEAYFHPRQLAFALGLLAVGGFLDRRWRLTIALLLVAALVHPTTAAWFIVWLSVAAWARSSHRVIVGAGAAAGAVVAATLLLRGPLAGHFVVMDADWLAAIGEKDLFPLAWPMNVWFTNLVALPIIGFAWQRRRAAGLLIPGETPLVVGAFALFALFLCWLPFDVADVALAVQLQASRTFWLLDVFATVYLIWLVAEDRAQPSVRRAVAATALIVTISLARGAYSRFVEFPDRPLFAVDISNADWRDAMAFAQSTDPGSGWLADPIHAAKYGSSLRAAGHRDVLLEQLKDHAIAMYDRGIAMRIADRERALAALPWDTPDGARALARRYGLDYLVIDREIDLPRVHQSGSLFIYRLR